MKRDPLYFSTRDLLMMAALAALGGVVSTYANTIGDLLQSTLGFAGSFQWAAGLHVLWLTLAVGLTRKQGAGTVTGLLKGGVELLTGNTHGLLILLVDVAAGLLVDLGFLLFRRKDSLPAFCTAGGLAAASNVLVFQLFASLPADILAYGAIGLLAAVAGLSGVVLAGVLGWALLNALRRAGVVKDRAPVPMRRAVYPIFLVAAVLLAVAFTIFLRGAWSGPPSISIGGAVEAAYEYPLEHDDIPVITAEGTLSGTISRYEGVPIGELIAAAQPRDEASLLLIRASDGYAFFVSMEEVKSNGSLLLSPQGKGKKTTYNIVGAKNQKAWVRGVSELVVIGTSTLPVEGELEKPSAYDPNEWQFQMDSTQLDLGDGSHKYQGAPLGKVLEAMEPKPGAQAVVVHAEGKSVSLSLVEVLPDKDLRIFTVIGASQITFALARMDGEVLLPAISSIEVR
jgi:ABC-type thiamin/hydroxymethylpyrimidine transport system permease subunit/DMSO/TMAO reductase YedYZ molybdopterin-dependent catalytic subunit